MIEPVTDEAAEQVGPAQNGAIRRGRAAQDDVVAAAGASVATVDHEFLGGKTCLPCFFVKGRRVVNEVGPASRGMNVDFDHARIRRDLEVQ